MRRTMALNLVYRFSLPMVILMVTECQKILPNEPMLVCHQHLDHPAQRSSIQRPKS